MKSILNNWMERIFLYKEIPRNEFTYKNAKKLVSVSDPREKITKKELDDIVSELRVEEKFNLMVLDGNKKY